MQRKTSAIMLVAAVAALIACQTPADMKDPTTLNYGAGEDEFVFRSPDGYCIDRPSLRTVQGHLNAEVEFTEVSASNCLVEDGKAIPEALTNIVTVSISETTRTLEQEIELLTGIAPIELQKDEMGYRIARDGQGVHTEGLITKIKDYIVYIRITDLTGSEVENGEEIVNQTYEMLKGANA